MISWNTIFEDFHFFGQNEDIGSPTFLEAHRQEFFFCPNPVHYELKSEDLKLISCSMT